MADKITREFTLLNKYGMHVRPAGLFAKTASRFNADVEVEKDGNVVSGKSTSSALSFLYSSFIIPFLIKNITVTTTASRTIEITIHTIASVLNEIIVFSLHVTVTPSSLRVNLVEEISPTYSNLFVSSLKEYSFPSLISYLMVFNSSTPAAGTET
jgi:hypothetical protein